MSVINKTAINKMVVIATEIKSNCKVARTYKKGCEAGKLCNPQPEFDCLETCKDCTKIL